MKLKKTLIVVTAATFMASSLSSTAIINEHGRVSNPSLDRHYNYICPNRFIPDAQSCASKYEVSSAINYGFQNDYWYVLGGASRVNKKAVISAYSQGSWCKYTTMKVKINMSNSPNYRRNWASLYTLGNHNVIAKKKDGGTVTTQGVCKMLVQIAVGSPNNNSVSTIEIVYRDIDIEAVIEQCYDNNSDNHCEEREFLIENRYLPWDW